MHKPGIAKSNLSQRIVTVEYTVARQSQNMFEYVYDISSILENARQEAIREVYKVFVDNRIKVLDYNEIFISSANYSFNSDRQLIVTMTAEFPSVWYTNSTSRYGKEIHPY